MPTLCFQAGASSIPVWAMLDERALREEYVCLVGCELRCGKLRLIRSVEAVGRVFQVGKSTARHQRKIWNGAEIRENAAPPPAPHRLANPSSFTDIKVSAGDKLHFSKRDAHTYFETLRAPACLQPWFGQPPASLTELEKHVRTAPDKAVCILA